ncbi:MAG: DNA mismatch repair endonuclease MutL [Bacteroidaceae bacterium]|nr:DNA mismatch repair endonuclease MutL [Bacteroidaceae bacterium]
MSDVIHLLPDSVANQIAAGEVIQRPASVIKELVENSIDAGARQIEILVMDAGKTSIQVIDDGKGMSETDARLAFERHATSKIREASDLFALTTMGFRGEALASIAAVAQVELRTRRKEDELGTCIAISGSKVESQEAVACAHGSNFSVKNLFFNVPARRKFLKSNQTELSNILTEIDRIVLVHPDISFVVSHNGNELYRLPATSLRMRLMNVFGKKLNEQLLAVEVDTTLVKVSGYVAKPESSRKKGAHQYFFVNGRYMRHPYFHKAVMEPYERLIPVGEQVSYFIYMEVDPANIDVNIHPTKTEIKFENEQAIWQILAAAVKEALGKFNEVPSIDFDTEGMPDIPSFEGVAQLEPPKVNYNPDYNPFKTSSSERNYSRPSIDWEYAYKGLEKESGLYRESRIGQEALNMDRTEAEELFPISPSEKDHRDMAFASGAHYQFKGQYILASVKSGLMIVNQHRAHVRILYDRYMAQIEGQKGVSQGLLFPEILQLTQAECVMLESLQDDMAAVGFELTNIGGGSYSINGIPAGTEGLHAADLVRRMLDAARGKGSDVKSEVRSIMALSLAKSAAMVAGQVLNADEMNEMVTSLFTCSVPNYTPDGKKVIHIIPLEEVERNFG